MKWLKANFPSHVWHSFRCFGFGTYLALNYYSVVIEMWQMAITGASIIMTFLLGKDTVLTWLARSKC